jgi:integrase/recombinase XerD
MFGGAKMAEGYQGGTQGTLQPGNADTDLDSVMRFYRVTAQAEGKSPKTVAITATAVSSLRHFLKGKGYATDVTKIGVLELREFILHLQQVKAFENHPDTHTQKRGLAGHTIHAYLRSLRAFWNWCVLEEFIARSPFTKLRIPRAPQKVIVTFTESQLRDLLKAVDISKPAGFRDWTIVLTLLDTGLRASELVGLTLESVRLEDGILRVHGKGNKERIVPIGSRVQRAIWKYVHRYRPEPANPLCTNVFLTREKATGEPETRCSATGKGWSPSTSSRRSSGSTCGRPT